MAQDEGAGGPCNLGTGWGLSQMVCYQVLPQLCRVILDTPLHLSPSNLFMKCYSYFISITCLVPASKFAGKRIAFICAYMYVGKQLSITESSFQWRL